jgi:predicted transcriptional regulator
MRRIQIYIEEDLDEALQAEATKTGRSKAAIIRECVAARIGRRGAVADDPITALVGSIDVEPADIDEVVYGP